MRILVTGASGFIGSNLVRAFRSLDWDVTIITRSKTRLNFQELSSSKLLVKIYDGNLDSLYQAFEVGIPDLVVHLSSMYLSEHKPDDIAEMMAANIVFPTKLLETMNHFGVQRLINTGTSWQNYRDNNYCPVNLYAASKQAFESIANYYVDSCKIKIVTLKLFDTYGPGDNRPKLFTLLRRSLLDGTELEMSPGEQLIDLVYVDDVVNAYLCAVNLFHEEFSHQSYAVGASERVTLRELVEIYQNIVGRKISIKWGSRPYRTREVMVPWNSSDKLPQWSPKIGLIEGISNMEISNGIIDRI